MLIDELLSIRHCPEAKVLEAVSPGNGPPIQYLFANAGILVDEKFRISVNVGTEKFLEKSAVDVSLSHVHLRVLHMV